MAAFISGQFEKMKITLIEDWHKSWKLLSVWVFAAIGAFPDIYGAVVAMGWSDELPEPAKWTLRAMAVIGIAGRLIKQNLDSKNESSTIT